MQDLAKSLERQRSLAEGPVVLQHQHSAGISNTSKQLLHVVASKKEAELRNELFGRVSADHHGKCLFSCVLLKSTSSSSGVSANDSSRQSLRYRRLVFIAIDFVYTVNWNSTCNMIPTNTS